MPSVLLAEPSAPVAGALRRYLEGAGHAVTWVGSAEDALRTLRERPPDVLLASGTGSLDGESLCRDLRAQGSAVPMLLVYPPEEDHADTRASEAGADGCLVGPLKRGTVLTCVALVVQREEARRWVRSATGAEEGVAPGSRVGMVAAVPGLRAGVAPELSGGVAPEEDFGDALGEGSVPASGSMATRAPLGTAPGAMSGTTPGGASGMGPGSLPGTLSAPPPGMSASSIASRATGFAITPVPGTLTVLEPEGRRVTRPELPSMAPSTSPDFEFLKRLMLMEVKRSRRYRYPIAVLLVELDGFAERSASLSPAARTAVLAEALGQLVAGVRDIDVAVPFADSRFVVFLPHTPRSGALVVAERLLERVRAVRSLPDASVSVGVAVSEPPSGKAPPPGAQQGQVSFGGLLKEAGEALRRAQAAGGNRVEPAAQAAGGNRV